MVKLRGQRLELGEVEARMKRFLPHDARVCVELMSMQSHSDRLVAFVTTLDGDRLMDQDWLAPPSSGTRATFSALHSSLTTVLPSYMIPSLYVPLNTMPTTFSGKTDRKLLRTWYSNSSNSELEKYLLWKDGKKATRTINESHIQGLWSRVLNKDRSIIGIDDNFFTVGGDSL
jgi:acyl-CoA synthetase (AMP-forming)/AMP-acid ligase II